ncbi:MAG: Hsp20/alpha crystallin family protein [Thermoanaerobaculia bacterium]
MTPPRRTRPPVTFVLGMKESRPRADMPSMHGPAVDVVDDGAQWRLVFEVPGAVAEKLAVEVKGRLVTLRGERRSTEGEGGTFLRVERASGPFERSVELPDDPDPERARASYSDGLLTMEIPRRSTSNQRSIPIRQKPDSSS